MTKIGSTIALKHQFYLHDFLLLLSALNMILFQRLSKTLCKYLLKSNLKHISLISNTIVKYEKRTKFLFSTLILNNIKSKYLFLRGFAHSIDRCTLWRITIMWYVSNRIRRWTRAIILY